ncbi:MAG: STT3 domain-containing protein [Candidatus Micrarchaeia archaeon]
MTTILQILLQSIPIFLSIVIPGFLVALALLRRTNLHLFELFFIGIVFGIATPSIMAFTEFLIGIPFSLGLHVINLAIITIVSIAVIIKDKINILPKSKPNVKTLYAFLILAVILFLAWWIRLQAISPFFYEFDPYWYNTITEFIIKEGRVPLHADKAWWPQYYTYRGMSTVVQYSEAGWYHIYAFTNGIKSFDFTTMTLVSSLYPAMAAALMCFFAYLWLSREYGKAVGILAAGFLAFTPILVDKMLAGEFELQPWGLFGIIFFLAFYALTLKTNSKRFALVTAFAMMICFLGSGAGNLPIYLFIGVSSIAGIIKYVRNELDMEFIKLNLVMVSGIFISSLLYIFYISPLGYIPGTSVLAMSIGFVILLCILFYLQSISKSDEDNLLYLIGIIVGALILAIFTPLGGVITNITELFFSVVTYTDPTFQTIAEQTVSGSSLHSAVGILGIDLSNFSIVPIIVIFGAAMLLLSVYSNLNAHSLLSLISTTPLSLTGLFKVKFTPYSGLFVPLLFCFGIGEVCNRTGKYGKYIIIALGVILLCVQALNYYDIFLTSINISGNVDITNNSAISANCSAKYQEILSVASNVSVPIVKDIMISAKSVTHRTYCNRIPEHWLNAMYWLKENAGIEERTISWWDYGHWITTFGQRKSVTDNTHWYTLMHQEVADKFVYNTPEALIQYMKEHKAKYMLLDQDLIAKWGALVYHACYYNNKTDIKTGPGASECDREYSPEFIFIPMEPTSSNLCSSETNGKKDIKVYSPYYGSKNQFGYYCASIDSLNQNLQLLQYGMNFIPLSLKYENGKPAGITNGMFYGNSGGYLAFLATYPSNSPDRKGKFYDSVFYKGFFEGEVPGFKQVHPIQNFKGPLIPVRIFELNERDESDNL